MNQKAISAVIGVILMVAITVAIAATVYVYVEGKVEDSNNSSQKIIYYNTTGRFNSIKEVDCYNVIIGNTTIKNVNGISDKDYSFLLTLSGKNCTFYYYTKSNSFGINLTFYENAILN